MEKTRNVKEILSYYSKNTPTFRKPSHFRTKSPGKKVYIEDYDILCQHNGGHIDMPPIYDDTNPFRIDADALRPRSAIEPAQFLAQALLVVRAAPHELQSLEPV